MSIRPFDIPGSDGRPVRGDVWLPDHVPGPAPVVVGIHGFKGFRRWGFWPAIGTRLNASGLAFVNFDASHNGVGPGGLDFDEPHLFERNTWTREEEDLAAVLGALRSEALPGGDRIDAARLALVGHSRGGGLAVVRAADDPGVRAVVGLAPIASTRRFDDATLEEGRRRGFLPIVNTRTGETLRFGIDAIEENVRRTELRDLAANFAARLAAPLLVVHGGADEAVPPEEGRRLAAAAPHGTFVLVPGADHVLGCRHPWAGTTPAFETFVAAAVPFLRDALG